MQKGAEGLLCYGNYEGKLRGGRDLCGDTRYSHIHRGLGSRRATFRAVDDILLLQGKRTDLRVLKLAFYDFEGFQLFGRVS